MKDDRVLVYSTDGSLPLPRAAQNKTPAKRAPSGSIPEDGILRIGCERRRGGSMTLVYGLAAGELASVGTELRRRCGTGGTAKNGIVELQGDHRDAVLAYFAERGRRGKRMGG
ncbi:MAG: stress response translation initiation inhibitor YciH [Candidatus Baltobacteraceae bacterium]